MGSNVLTEHMHDDVAEVHENPLRCGESFEAQRPDAESGENGLNVIRDGADLALGVAGAENEVIGNGRQGSDVKDQDVAGLFFEGRLSNSNGSRLRLLCDQRPP